MRKRPAYIGLIEFDIIKVSRRGGALPLSTILSPFSPRNNYGLRCSIAFVSALHLYPLVLTCTNILVRIEEEEDTVERRHELRRAEREREELVVGWR